MRDATPIAVGPGRPPLPDPRIETVLGLLRDGKDVNYVVLATGVKKTKVYELRRLLKEQQRKAPTDAGQ